jgi:hypothetical protein
MKFRGKYLGLSNMYECECVMEDGKVYKSSESVFQMLKCENKEDMKKFIGLNGWEAKKLGRRVRLRSDWLEVRDDCMRIALRSKFYDKALKWLKGIEEDIVEDNHWGDRYWGRCNGVGENKLGILLMELRDGEDE